MVYLNTPGMISTIAVIVVAIIAPVVSGNSVTTPSCVVLGSDVDINFEDDNAMQGDWIGLLPLSRVGSQVPDTRSDNWVWTCGSQSCGSLPDNGSVRISNPNLSNSTDWVAFLARFDGGVAPYELVAASATFRVDTTCSEPSAAPTTLTLPVSGSAKVVTDKTSYDVDKEFTVAFSIPNTVSGDWVGIFEADTPLDDQSEAHFWLWAGCDRQGSLANCESRESGSLVFKEDRRISWLSSWPLAPGRYVAAILRDGDSPPWEALDVSPVFEIRAPQMSPALIKLVHRDIARLIEADIELASKFLRLGFHDSVGGPDGCVDMTNNHNAGLHVPIDALAPIVDKYRASMSRADVWALAAMAGSEVSQPEDASFRVDFAFTEFGRIDCELQQSVCRNEAGISHGCSVKRGPHRVLPGANTNTHELFGFFKTNYGFNTRETVAIMGAHTIGVLARENSGIDGRNGWVLNNRELDNRYYDELVGGSGPDSSVRSLVQSAPNWKRHFEDNSDLDGFEDVDIWHGLPEGRDGRVIVMLNADIAVVRDLDEENMNSETGEVSCQFVDRSGDDPTCPHVDGALQEAARYKFSNRAWLIDFEDVLRQVLNVGYTITSNCIDDLCKLEKL